LLLRFALTFCGLFGPAFVIRLFPGFIGVNDARDHRVANDVFTVEEVKANFVYLLQHLNGVAQA
jgi:hypothetical protein